MKEKIKVGFLGPMWSFSHEAANNVYGDDFEPIPKNSFPDVFSALSKAECGNIIIPIDNSIEGIVTQAADILAATNDPIAIYKEYVLSVRQNLIMIPNAKISDVRRIYSHPQALGQCRNLIENVRNKYGNDVEEIPTKSTSEASQVVRKNNDAYSAAIGSKLSASHFGLSVVAEDIADSNNNQTRFLIIGGSKSIPTGDDKTFIVFSVKDNPGGLVRVLEVFGVLGINMTMINSRPSKKRIGEYVFFVEFVGHIDDPNIKVALQRIKERSDWIRNLGSYPVYHS